MPERKTTKQFIVDAILIFGDKYDYSLVNYINNKTKVKIICKDHDVFEQKPNDHLCGHGCSKCSGTDKVTLKKFIDCSNIAHNFKYDYSLVEQFKTNKDYVDIICPVHGEFNQEVSSHMKGIGCSKCSGNFPLTRQDIIEKASKFHLHFYDYSLLSLDIKPKQKGIIICPKHGEFSQKIESHLRGNGCPKCKASNMEKNIINYFLDNQIEFECQKSFDDCRYKSLLKFDFYLPKYHKLIEYDGELHYMECSLYGGKDALELTKLRDDIKTNYCNINNIPLLRINYQEKKNFDILIKNFIPLLRINYQEKKNFDILIKNFIK